MAGAIIAYDRELPEIVGRQPFLPPDCFLKKKDGADGEFEIVTGRRPSQLLVIGKLRSAVDDWRKASYPGASDVTRRLFEYWFDEDHEVPGFGVSFHYHFCQREAIETLAYLVEIAHVGDARVLVETF